MKNVFDVGDDVSGVFWTVREEMIEDLERWGYDVLLVNDEFVAIAVYDDECDQAEFLLYLGHANKTMWVEKIREVA